MAVRLTTEEFISKAIEVHGDKYDYSKVNYINSHIKVSITCKEHGEFQQKPNNHLNGFGCKKCGRKSSIESRFSTTEEFILKAVEVHGDKYDYSKVVYSHNKLKVIMLCNEHGEFQQTPNCHLKGQGCPECGRIKQHQQMFSNSREFVEKSVKIHGDKYDYNKTDYISNKRHVIISCPIHGEFPQKPYHHLRGQGCFRCSISSHHLAINRILDEANVRYNDNNRDVLGGYEIDILIPDYNIGIEINGCYWHGATNLLENKKYRFKHSSKYWLSNEIGITLLQFWDYEIESKFNVIVSMIRHRLGLSNKIYARNCRIKIVDNRDISDFVNNSHLQGHRDARLNYVLVYNDEIIAVLNFSRHKHYEWEIIRYVCKPGYAVIGGFSKLLNKFIVDNNPSVILTFADSRYSHGNVYSKNGFVSQGISKPNYFYYKSGNKLSRHQCQKQKLRKLLGEDFNPNLSESENMLNNEYIKVYDAGHHKMLWYKS